MSAVAFGSLPIFAKQAYADGAGPVAVLFGRFAVAAVGMLALLAARGERLPRGRLLGALVALGGLGYVGQSLSFFTAAALIPASLASLLLYTFPAMVAVLAAVLLGTRLTPAGYAALGLALAGALLTVGGATGGRPLGIALGLVSAVMYASYIVIGSQLTARAGAVPSATVIIVAAAAVYGLLTLLTRPAFPHTGGGWAAVLGLALLSTVVAIGTFFAGLQRVGPTDASTLSTLEPLVTVCLAAAVLAERIRPAQMVGGALILVAVVVLARSGRRAPGPGAEPAA